MCVWLWSCPVVTQARMGLASSAFRHRALSLLTLTAARSTGSEMLSASASTGPLNTAITATLLRLLLHEAGPTGRSPAVLALRKPCVGMKAPLEYRHSLRLASARPQNGSGQQMRPWHHHGMQASSPRGQQRRSASSSSCACAGRLQDQASSRTLGATKVASGRAGGLEQLILLDNEGDGEGGDHGTLCSDAQHVCRAYPNVCMCLYPYGWALSCRWQWVTGHLGAGPAASPGPWW